MHTAAIIGGSPAFRCGLQAALDDHWRLRRVERIADAVAGDLLVVVASRADDPTIAEASTVHDSVVVLLPAPTAEDHVTAVRAGAIALVDSEGEPDDITMALHDATVGHVRIPICTLQRLAAIARSPRDRPALAPPERRLLKLLARGDSIRDIARAGHWSERAMHRVLRSIYLRIGVTNRDQAVAWAAGNGVLTDEGDS